MRRWRVVGVCSAVTFLAASFFFACVGDDPGAPGGNPGPSAEGGFFEGGLPADGSSGSDAPATGDAADAADVPPPATGTPKWVHTLKGAGTISNDALFSSAVTFDAAGNVYIGGSYLSGVPVDLGDGKSLPANTASAGGYDGFIVKYSPTGTCLWGVPLSGNDSNQTGIVGLAATGNGELVFAASTSSASIQLDKPAVNGKGNADIAVGRLAADGTQVWLRIIGGTTYETPAAVAVDLTAGRMAVAGSCIRDSATDVSFDGIFIDPPQRQNTLGFVALLDLADGLTKSVKGFPVNDAANTSVVTPHAVAFDASGNVILGGEFTGSIDLRYKESTSQTATSNGSNDGFIAKIDKTNKVVWATTIGGSSDPDAGQLTDNVHGLGVDPSGNVVAAFNYGVGVTLGATNLPSFGFADVGIARFSPTGTVIDANGYGSASSDTPSSIAVDRWGQIIVGGLMQSSINFGKPATAVGAGDGFVAKLSATYAGQWAYGIGGSNNNDQTNGVAVDKAGNVAIVGTIGGSANPITVLGTTVNVPQAQTATFIAVTSP